jgi:transposase
MTSHAPSTVHEYFRRWRSDGTWVAVHGVLRTQVRESEHHAAQPSAGIVDSQSVKTNEASPQTVEAWGAQTEGSECCRAW